MKTNHIHANMTFTENIIQRYKSIRTRRQLGDVCRKRYAFVGIGSHSIANLYPVLAHLRVPVKYICCRSTTKAAVAAEKFSGIKVTTSLDEILEDNEIAGVFVSASPSAHFDIAAKILGSGKSLFIEKPPCSSAEELGRLKDMIILHGTPTAMAGMQKRYAPATQILKSRLRHQRPISYNMKYLTGSYPEGDMLSDLFIHPLDYVTFLFGRAEITGIDSVSHSHGAKTMMLLLRHGDTAGTLELSTAYTWTEASETMTINTRQGVYRIRNMEELTYTRKPATPFGIPADKVFGHHPTSTCLLSRNNFIPTTINNQIYTQGFYNELKAFCDLVEGKPSKCLSSFETLQDTYRLMEDIRTRTHGNADKMKRTF